MDIEQISETLNAILLHIHTKCVDSLMKDGVTIGPVDLIIKSAKEIEYEYLAWAVINKANERKVK